MATGAIDRPVTFANNDRPGVLSLSGVVDYLARYGVLAGRNMVVMAPHALARSQVEFLQKAGAKVDVIEAFQGTPEAMGGKNLNGLIANGRRHECDTILTSAGLMPVVHLWRHAGGKLRWDDTMACFVPDAGPDWMTAIGGANGVFEINGALADARAAAKGTAKPMPDFAYSANPPISVVGSKARQWIDVQHDVTFKDIELAARENYVSVEHLERRWPQRDGGPARQEHSRGGHDNVPSTVCPCAA